MRRYIYFIKNSVNEYSSRIVGYFETLDEAKEALKSCENYYASKGTGRIYRIELGLHKDAELVYHA